MPIAGDVSLGRGVVVHHLELVNLYGCAVGDETRIGPFVELQKGAVVSSRCKISPHTSLSGDRLGKKLAIVQSNYIPWKGYFDLIPKFDTWASVRNRLRKRNDLMMIMSSQNRGEIVAEVLLMLNTLHLVDRSFYDQSFSLVQSPI